MKKLKTSRFTTKLPEEISFQGTAISENPKTKKRSKPVRKRQKSKSVRTNVRKVERTNERSVVRSTDRSDGKAIFLYKIEVPAQRRKVRHSFDIFEDQMSALENLQLAIAEHERKKPALGDMVQEAIDLYTKQKTKKLKNIELIFHN